MQRALVVALLVVSPALRAQAPHTVAPGMSRAQVVATLGEPATLRAASDFTYLFYLNSCGKRCGMNDLVVLHADSVVDAIFRSPDRHYSGTSSSPASIAPGAARQRGAADSTTSSKRMKPAPANDTRPSIPANEPKVLPAPKPKPKPPAKAP